MSKCIWCTSSRFPKNEIMGWDGNERWKRTMETIVKLTRWWWTNWIGVLFFWNGTWMTSKVCLCRKRKQVTIKYKSPQSRDTWHLRTNRQPRSNQFKSIYLEFASRKIENFNFASYTLTRKSVDFSGLCRARWLPARKILHPRSRLMSPWS